MTSWDDYLMILETFFLIFFIKAYIVGIHLNCLNLSRQFKRVPTTYAFIKKQIKVHKLVCEDYKIVWPCVYKGMCGNQVEYSKYNCICWHALTLGWDYFSQREMSRGTAFSTRLHVCPAKTRIILACTFTQANQSFWCSPEEGYPLRVLRTDQIVGIDMPTWAHVIL